MHLGIDLYMRSNAPVYAPLDGRVHSFNNNRDHLDYGPAIILEHHIEDDQRFYTLYGHLSAIHVEVGQEVDTAIKEAGEQAAFDLGVHGIHAELIKYLGRLKYRTSYAQNVLQHSVEVGVLCGIMASELGLKEKLARRMGLLHDIGKAIDHEVEGPHAVIGSKLAKKFGESSGVVHAIGAHHEDVPPSSVYALLVQAADGLSGARPGARVERTGCSPLGLRVSGAGDPRELPERRHVVGAHLDDLLAGAPRGVELVAPERALARLVFFRGGKGGEPYGSCQRLSGADCVPVW